MVRVRYYAGEDRAEEDKNPGSIARQYEFKKIYNGTAMRNARFRARRTSMQPGGLEELLKSWGYVTKGIMDRMGPAFFEKPPFPPGGVPEGLRAWGGRRTGGL